jgi:hypothetical protein
MNFQAIAFNTSKTVLDWHAGLVCGGHGISDSRIS